MPALRFTASRSSGAVAFALLVAWLVAIGGRAAGQSAEGPPRENGSAAVKQVAPEIYYLRDDAGQLVPVPGFRYHDFVDLLRLKEGLPGLPETPAAVLESIQVTGTLAGPGRSVDASSPLTVTLTVRQIRPGWVSVPLELGGFVITGEPKHSGEGRFLLAVDPAADVQERGYQGWFEGKADTRHSVVLVGTAAVEAAPNAESIRLRLPGATASLVELQTPRTDPVVTVRPAVVEPRVAPAQAGGGSVISFAGLAGATQIRVAARESGQSPSTALAQAAVESLVRIDGRIAVIDAVIRLDNLPPETETIRIALPPRAAVKAVRPPAALVERAGSDEQPIAVVQVERTAAGAAAVELVCERPIDASGGEHFEPQGFAIEGIPAWRQRGRTSLVVEGDWQLEWDEFARNRRIDPPSSARQPGFVAAFAYESQPASLPLRVRPRGSRVVMEPEYRYEIGATRIGLEARFRVSVRGAPVSRIVVGLEGWGIDEVGPSSLVDTSAVSGESKALVIPFLQPLAGDAVVEIRAGRSIERSADRLSWKTPVPRADLVGPANVVITSQSDIEVLPDTDAIRGLVRQVASAGRRGDGERPTIAYRLDGVEGTFAASRRFLPRRVDATVSTQATIDEADTIVDQTVRFQVAHVPLEFVDLVVPDSIVRSRSLEVRQGGQLLQPFVAEELTEPREGGAEESDFESPPLAQTLRAMLPVPLLGSGELAIRYSIPTASIPPETTVAEELPIVTPDGVRISQQTFTLFAQDQLAVDVRGDAWTRDAGLQSSASARSWTAAKSQTIVPLAISARQRSTAGETVVEAAWLETRLLPDRRDDVYTYAVATSAERISLSLPEGFLPLRDGETDPGAVEVRLDGQVVPGAVRPDGRVTVELPRPVAVNRGAWLLQIASTCDRSGLFGIGAAGMPAAVVLAPPVFAEGAVLRRFYWELRLEADQHVVVPPARWTAQQQWRWGAFGFERVPVISREVLASWVRADTGSGGERLAGGLRDAGALTPPVDAPLAERRAVYSGVGFAGAARVWIVPTWLLVLAVSGPTLALGLAFVYRPAVRRTSVVLALASGLVLAASAMPELAPLFAQAAVPGLVFSLVAAGLRFFVGRPAAAGRSRPAPIVTSGSSTRFVPAASLVIAPSAMQSHDSATAPGRSAS